MPGNVTTGRLRALREQLGLTQQDLGQAVGVTRQTIASWERGESSPTLAQCSLLARAVGLPLEALLSDDASAGAALLFRADQPDALRPDTRAALARKVADYADMERLVGEVSTLPPSHPMDTYSPVQVEEAARRARYWLGIDDGPLPDPAAWLDSLGVKVMLQQLPAAISGFSAYTDEWGAAIFVNRNHPGERQTFTLLHELGHLILHRKEYSAPHKGVHGRHDPREKAVQHFAGAVLLPEVVLQRELHGWRGRWLPEPLLLDLKRRYRVSMRTVLLRAADIGILTRKQAGQQVGVLNQRYGRDGEPEQLPSLGEPTRLRRLVFRALLDDLITVSRAAEVLESSVGQIRQELALWLGEAPA